MGAFLGSPQVERLPDPNPSDSTTSTNPETDPPATGDDTELPPSDDTTEGTVSAAVGSTFIGSKSLLRSFIMITVALAAHGLAMF